MTDLQRRHSKNILSNTRQKVKIEFTICIKQVLGLPKSTTGSLLISWKRGSKKENSGESKAFPVKDQSAVFELYQDPKKGFEEKSVVFTLKEDKAGKKHTLGKLAIDLAEFANSKTERIRTFTIKEKKTPVANITLSFKTLWLKMDGKTLVRADTTEAPGKEKVSIDGNDYFLQTEDELSIDETDQKSGGAESDEEVVEFEDDEGSQGVPPKSPNNSRKSSSGNLTAVSSLSGKGPSTPTTPQTTLSPTPMNTFPISPAAPTPAPTPTPTTPPSSRNQTSTPTPSTPPPNHPTIQVTSPGSETKEEEDHKVKKYKKKLKAARKDADDLRAELAKKEEQWKASSQNSAASAETAAQLAALQKKDAEARETEATLRKEVEEANRRAAETQAAVDALKRGGDDASQKQQHTEEVLRAAEAKLQQSEHRVSEAEAKLKQSESRVTEIEAKLKQSEAALADSSSRNNQGRGEMEAKVRELEAKIRDFEVQIGISQGQKKSAEEAVDGERKRLREVEGERDREMREKMIAERTLQEVEQRARMSEEAVRTNEQKIREMEAQMNDERRKNEELGSLKKQNDDSAKIQASSALEMARVLELEQRRSREWEEKWRQAESELKAAKSTLDVKVVQLGNIVEERDGQLKEFTGKLETERADREKLAKQVEELQKKERDERSEDSHSSEEENARLRELLKELEGEIGKLREQFTLLEHNKNEELEHLKEEAGENLAKLGQLETELEEARRKASTSEQTVVELQQKLEQLEHEAGGKKKLEDDVSKLQNKNAELESKVEAAAKFQKEVEELQEKNEQLELEVSKANAANESQIKQITKLTSRLDEVEQENQRAVEALAKLEEAEKDKRQLEEEVSELNEKISQLEAQVQSGAGKDEELVAELQTKNKKAEKEVSNLKRLLEDSDEAIADKDKQIERLREELQAASESAKSAGDTSAQLLELEAEAKKYKKKATKYEDLVMELEKQLEEARQHKPENGKPESDEKLVELENKYRTTQDRVEELDDEIDRLKKRELVLNELNEATEKRIEELEAELKARKAALPLSGSAADADLARALEEASQQQKRVQELESALAAAQEASQAGSGADSAVGSGGEEVSRLMREVEEYKKVEKAVYGDETGFTPADVSKTATAVWQLLAATRELDSEPRAQDPSYPLRPLAQKVVTALEKSFRRTPKDNTQISYWLSCVCSLLHFIHQRDNIPAAADPVLQGIQVDREQFVNGTNHAEHFGRAIQDLTLGIYSTLAVNLQESVQKLIIPAFLHEDQAVMDVKSTPTRNASQAQVHSPNGHSPSSPKPSSRSNAAANYVPSLTQLTDSLSAILTTLRESRVPPAVVRQLFHQLLHFIAGCVLNSLLYGKELSTATHGLRIKLAVSRVDEWLAKQDSDIASAGERLNLIRDAAGVLLLDKSMFIEADNITTIFQSLNLVQVRKLLDLFQPDSVSPSPVPSSVRQMMDTYWGYSPHNMPLLVDVTALVVVN